MEIVERYLQAVRFWLPKGQQRDIAAELSEDIYAQIEEKEAEIGRPLNQAEVEGVLKQRGRPVLVANGFLPQNHLIGPVLFPVYVLVLKIVLLSSLIPLAIFQIGVAIYKPTDYLTALGSLVGSMWSCAFLATASVTMVFTVLEKAEARSHFLKDWDPSKLPPLRDPTLIQRANSITELVANLVILIWWTANMSTTVVMGFFPNLRVTLSPVWMYFFWGFLLLTLLNIALAATHLVRPYWTGTRATIRLLTDCAGSALLCWLLKANLVISIAAAGVSPARSVEITEAVNVGMARAFPAAVLAGLVIAGFSVYRIVRLKGGETGMARGRGAMAL